MDVSVSARPPDLSLCVCGPGPRAPWHFEFANFRVHAAVVGCIKLRFAVCSFGCAAGALLALSPCCSAACHAHALLYASRSPPAARVLILNSRISQSARAAVESTSAGAAAAAASRIKSISSSCSSNLLQQLLQHLQLLPPARVLTLNSRIYSRISKCTKCTRLAATPTVAAHGSSKQQQVHQQLILLISAAAAIVALAAGPATTATIAAAANFSCISAV